MSQMLCLFLGYVQLLWQKRDKTLSKDFNLATFKEIGSMFCYFSVLQTRGLHQHHRDCQLPYVTHENNTILF